MPEANTPDPTGEKIEETIRRIQEIFDQRIEQLTSQIQEMRKSPSFTEAHFLSGEKYSASNQWEYFSNQFFKWDMEAVSVTPTGINIAGVEVFKSPLVRWLEETPLAVAGREQRRRRSAENSDDAASAASGSSVGELRRKTAELDQRISRTDQVANSYRQLAGQAREKAERTARSVGRELGTVRRTALVANDLAKSAHRRIDGVNRAQSEQRRRVQATTGRASVSGEDPKKLKDAAAQIRLLESRVNDLARALA